MADSPDLLGPFLRRGEHTLWLGSPFSGIHMLWMQLIGAMQTTDQPDFLGIPVSHDLRIGLVTLGNTHAMYEEMAHAAHVSLSTLAWWNIVTDDEFPFADFNRDPYPVLERGLSALISGHGALDLIVIVPLGDWLGVNLLHPTKPGVRLAELNSWARTHRCAILGTHLLNKARVGVVHPRPIDRVYGSQSLIQRAQSVWILEPCVEFQFKKPHPTRARLSVYQQAVLNQELMLDQDPEGSSQWVRVNPRLRLVTSVLTDGQERHAVALLGALSAAGAPIPYRTLRDVLGPSVGLTRDILLKLAPVLEQLDYLTRGPAGWTLTPAGDRFVRARAGVLNTDPNAQL